MKQNLENSFEKYIKSNPSYFFTYDMIYKEVESFQGIPDYLGIIMSHLYHGSEKTMQIPINRWHTISIILAFMKKKTVSYTKLYHSKYRIESKYNYKRP